MADGFRYVGQWKAGEIDGKGVATYANGDVYEGSFVAGKRQGEGVMRYATGQETGGEWRDGVLAAPAPADAAAGTEAARRGTDAPVGRAPGRCPGPGVFVVEKKPEGFGQTGSPASRRARKASASPSTVRR